MPSSSAASASTSGPSPPTPSSPTIPASPTVSSTYARRLSLRPPRAIPDCSSALSTTSSTTQSATTSPEVRVDISTGTRDKRPFLSITNTSPPIPPDHSERLFEPFQRLAERTGHRQRSRTRASDRASDRDHAPSHSPRTPSPQAADSRSRLPSRPPVIYAPRRPRSPIRARPPPTRRLRTIAPVETLRASVAGHDARSSHGRTVIRRRRLPAPAPQGQIRRESDPPLTHRCDLPTSAGSAPTRRRVIR